MPQTSTTVLAISRYTLFRAKQQILSCQACDPEASTPFREVLDHVTANDAHSTEYIMSESAKCPQCLGPVYEQTRVDWEQADWDD